MPESDPLALPSFPEVAPTIELTGLTLTLMSDFGRFRNGSLLLRIQDCHLIATNAEGKEIGGVGCAVGGPFYVEHEGRLWALSTESLFRATVQAETDQYLQCVTLVAPLLCQAWGETDLPVAKICRTPAELRAFFVSAVFGEDLDSEIPEAMSEIIGRDWDELGAWTTEFEIGRVQVHPVYAVQ